MLGPDRREGDTNECQGAAHRFAVGTRPGLPSSATRHPRSRTYAPHATPVKQTRHRPKLVRQLTGPFPLPLSQDTAVPRARASYRAAAFA